MGLLLYIAARYNPQLVEGFLLLLSGATVAIGLAIIAFWYWPWSKIGGLGTLPPVVWRVSFTLWPHPSLLALFLPVPLFLLLYKCFQSQVWFWQVLLALTLLIEVLAGVRGGWLGVTIAAFFWFIVQFNYQNKHLINWFRGNYFRVSIWSGYFLFLLYLVYWQIESRLRGNILAPSGRDVFWPTALRAWTSSPVFGIGPGNYPIALFRSGTIPPLPPFEHAHNVWLHIAAEAGAVGFLFLVNGVVITVWYAWQRHKNINNITLASGSILIAWAVHGLFEAAFFTFPPLQVVFWGVWGLFINGLTGASPIALPACLRRIRLSLVGIFLSVCAFLVVIANIRLFPSLENSWIGMDYVTKENWKEASVHFSKATENTSIAAPFFQAGYAYAIVSWEWHNFLDGTYSDYEMLDRSIEMYQRGLSLEPWYSPPWANLAILLWHRGDYTTALSAMQQAIEISPRSAYFLLYTGWMQEELGNTSQAIQLYSEALRISPSLSESIFFVTDFRQSILSKEKSSVEFAFEEKVCENGWRLFDRGKLVEAQRIFEECGNLLGQAAVGWQIGWSAERVFDYLKYIQFTGNIRGWDRIRFYVLFGDVLRAKQSCQEALPFYEQAFYETRFLVAEPAFEGWTWILYHQQDFPSSFVPGFPAVYPKNLIEYLQSNYQKCLSQ